MKRALVAFVLLLSGCGPHALELDLSLAPGCPTSVPAGGSVLYEVAVDPIGGDPARVCSACLAVPTTLNGADAILALLRSSAPPCSLPRDATLHVRVTSFAGADCAPASAGTTNRLCSTSDKITVGDGHGDQSLDAILSCQVGCDSVTCMPLSCGAQGAECGTISNGCGQTIDCGTCKPPAKCGGGGVDHVCGK